MMLVAFLTQCLVISPIDLMEHLRWLDPSDVEWNSRGWQGIDFKRQAIYKMKLSELPSRARSE